MIIYVYKGESEKELETVIKQLEKETAFSEGMVIVENRQHKKKWIDQRSYINHWRITSGNMTHELDYLISKRDEIANCMVKKDARIGFKGHIIEVVHKPSKECVMVQVKDPDMQYETFQHSHKKCSKEEIKEMVASAMDAISKYEDAACAVTI